MRKLSVCFFILLLIAACCKDKLIDPNPDQRDVIRPPRPMIKTLSFTDNLGRVSTEFYYYDSLWRLIKYKRLSGAPAYIDTFKYSFDYVERSSSPNLLLNSNGLVYSDDNPSSYSQKHYSYNTADYLVFVSGMWGNFVYGYDSSNNLTHRQDITQAGPSNYLIYDYNFTYNTHTNTIGNYNKGEYYFGKSSTNLVERESWHIYNTNPPPPPDSIRNFTLYNYTYNDSGWVSRMVQNAALINRIRIDSVTLGYDTTYTLYQFDYSYY